MAYWKSLRGFVYVQRREVRKDCNNKQKKKNKISKYCTKLKNLSKKKDIEKIA